ncbi:hypothetical protein HDU96_009357 [Phlyctochytrium bullatum]|nr:hypothetical protein HDU96_009357 [Phlyctochytrium bullatum]
MSRSGNKTIARIAVAGAAAAGTALLLTFWDDPIFASAKLDKEISRPKGGLPIVGDAFGLLSNLHRVHDYVQEIIEANPGRTIGIKLPFDDPIILINDPKMVEHVLKTHFHIYDKGAHFTSRCQDVLGHGIFNVDGDRWKSQRKTAANIFNVKNFKEFVGVVFADEMQVFASRLTRAASANPSTPVNLSDLFFRFTLDGFCKIGFGIDLGCMASDTPVPFAVAFDDAQTRMQYRFCQPLWWIEEAVGGLVGPGARQKKNVTVIREFAKNIIRKRREEGAAEPEEMVGGRKKQDLLAYLMEVKDENGNLPSDEDLVDYILNFIIAGRDTTAQALSWAFYLLHKHPEVVKELREEIDAVLGPYGDPSSRDAPTYEECKAELPYANAVFHETLRLYPSVPMELKQANRDDVLPDGTRVPKNALLSWAPWTMGRTESIWGPDAKHFRPSRWLEMDKQPSPFDYPVFNAGPRVCLGKNMAELEGVYVMCCLVRRFDVRVAREERVTYTNSLTLPMKEGMECFVTERKA